MRTYLRAVDLKVVLFALVACYAVPWLAIGTLSGVLARGMGTAGENAATLTMLAFFLVPPVLAGYFTARYSRQLPQLHVVLVAALGLAASAMWFHGPWFVYLGYGVAFVLLSGLGAFLRLRSAANAG